MTSNTAAKSILIRKYANRRLYDTSKSRYVTMDDLLAMVRAKVDFRVEDATSGQDLTRPTLLQIICDIEGNGNAMLPISVLQQLIQSYDGTTEPILARYLERVMSAFQRHQRSAEDALNSSLDSIIKTDDEDSSDIKTPRSDIENLRAEFAVLKGKMDKIA